MHISYRFQRQGERDVDFSLHLDPQRLEAVEPLPAVLPAWTRLGFHRCPHCPLPLDETAVCPLAARLQGVMACLGHGLSHEVVTVEVQAAGRTITQSTTAQRGISALLGLVTATSACPHTVYLKPMARFHLPFASEEETIYRAVSMYLLARYFQRESGQDVDFDLDGLTAIYRHLQTVNVHMAERLRAATEGGDAAVNALVLLDMYAKAMPAVVADRVHDIGYLFAEYVASTQA